MCGQRFSLGLSPKLICLSGLISIGVWSVELDLLPIFVSGFGLHPSPQRIQGLGYQEAAMTVWYHSKKT